jgi:hypothetical protein
MNAQASEIHHPPVKDPNWTDRTMTEPRIVTERIAHMKSKMPDLGVKLGLDDVAVDRLLAIELDVISRPNVDPKTSLNEKISSEFGSDIAQKYEDYQYAQVGSSATSAVLSAFTDADVPLSKAQSEQLATLYATAFRDWNPVARAPDPQNISMKDVLEQMNQIDRYIISSANSFLTEQQVSVLQQTQDRALKSKQAVLGL